MLKKLLTAFALTLVAAGVTRAQSVITNIDFDATDPDFIFPFSGNNNEDVPITTDLAAIGATGEGGSFTVNPDGPFPSDFAGGGFDAAAIDFTAAGFTAGAVTVADLDTITISADIATTGDGGDNYRIQPTGGGFGERIDLTFDSFGQTDGVFTNFSVPLSTVSLTEKTNFVNALNAANGGSGALTTSLSFSFSTGGNDFESGQSVTFDNIVVTVAAVPEPGSLAVLSLIGMTGMIRRKRI